MPEISQCVLFTFVVTSQGIEHASFSQSTAQHCHLAFCLQMMFLSVDLNVIILLIQNMAILQMFCLNEKNMCFNGKQGSGTVFTTLHFLCNLRIGPISQSATLQQAANFCQGQTLQLIGAFRKLRKKIKCCEYAPRCLFQRSFLNLRHFRFSPKLHLSPPLICFSLSLSPCLLLTPHSVFYLSPFNIKG